MEAGELGGAGVRPARLPHPPVKAYELAVAVLRLA